jgi:hypothetical protein
MSLGVRGKSIVNGDNLTQIPAAQRDAGTGRRSDGETKIAKRSRQDIENRVFPFFTVSKTCGPYYEGWYGIDGE